VVKFAYPEEVILRFLLSDWNVILYPPHCACFVCDALQDSSHLAVRCGVPCRLLCDCIMQ
jgi:hypothetical protein